MIINDVTEVVGSKLGLFIFTFPKIDSENSEITIRYFILTSNWFPIFVKLKLKKFFAKYNGIKIP